MNIQGRVYAKVEIDLWTVPETGQQVRITDSRIEVLVNSSHGQYWVRADSLETKSNAWNHIFDILLWRLTDVAGKSGKTKAETKRCLIRAGVISK